MPAKKSAPQKVDEAKLTADQAALHSGQIMSDLRAAATNLDQHIEALRANGLFELEESIFLDRNGNLELFLSGKGRLEVLEDDRFSPEFKISNPTTSIKAVRQFDIKRCLINLHTKLLELKTMAAQKRKDREYVPETVEMVSAPSKKLQPKR